MAQDKRIGVDAKNVAVAKPAATGCVWVAPAGTDIPKDAVSELPAIWKSVGYLSTDGVTRTPTRNTEEKKAYGGDTVLQNQTEFSETIAYTMIEINETSMKEVYGDNNVEMTADGGMHIVHNADELGEHAYVIEQILGNSRVRRICVERAKISEVGEQKDDGSELVGYPITLATLPGTDLAYSHEYVATVGEVVDVTEKTPAEMTLDELKVYAATLGVTLEGTESREDILAAIEAKKTEDGQ